MKTIRENVRVRFAPSPTGFLHIGGARTALFNFLFARHYKGKFLLRIEDTDQSRSTEKMVDAILDGLHWLGITWDEKPVFQSHRIEEHRKICRELLARGFAYRCFCTPEELKKKRESAKGGCDCRYDRTCLNLSEKEIQKKIDEEKPYTVRFRVPEKVIHFEDKIRGQVDVHYTEIEDFIVLRSDRTPVYHVAVVTDDHEMGITHVIRGDDHLSNTPKQILLYRAMGWPIPEFAHVPMIFGSDKKRLSKRHGAVSVQAYEESGYLPEAVINYLVLLGWSPGQNIEMMSLNEMIDCFALDRISKNPAVFDETKLLWMNGQYMQKMDVSLLLEPISKHMLKSGIVDGEFIQNNEDYLLQCILLMKERIKRLNDFTEKAHYFFNDPERYEEDAKKKYWFEEDVPERLRIVFGKLRKLAHWSATEIERIVRGTAESLDVDAGKLIHPIRLALTGSGTSPGLFEVMQVLGKSTVLRRIESACKFLENKE